MSISKDWPIFVHRTGLTEEASWRHESWVMRIGQGIFIRQNMDFIRLSFYSWSNKYWTIEVSKHMPRSVVYILCKAWVVFPFSFGWMFAIKIVCKHSQSTPVSKQYTIIFITHIHHILCSTSNKFHLIGTTAQHSIMLTICYWYYHEL